MLRPSRLRTFSFAAAALLGALWFARLAGSASPLAPIPGQPPVPAGGWILFQSHTHSHKSNVFSHNPATTPLDQGFKADGIVDTLTEADKNGIACIAITDHNAIGGWFDPSFRPVGRSVPLRGEEWTSGEGHAVLLGFRAQGPGDMIYPPRAQGVPTAAEYQAMVGQVHARGGVVVMAHPANLGRFWPKETHGVDGIEVMSHFFMLPSLARWRWQRWLAKGERLVGLSGCDHHYQGWFGFSPKIGKRLNLVRAASNAEADVLDAIRKGHVQVLWHRDSPRVYIGCDVDQDRVFTDYEQGDKVDARRFRDLDVQVRVTGGKNHILHLYDKTGQFDEVLIRSDDFTYRMNRRADPATFDFVRAEVRFLETTVSISNPLYF